MTTPSSSTDAPYLWDMTIGDDWSFPYTYTRIDGTPQPLANTIPQALLYARGAVAPVFAMMGSPGVTIVDPNAGSVIFRVARALTATLRADGAIEGYPTRIQVQLQDSTGLLTTYRVDPVRVEDARFRNLVLDNPAPSVS